MKVFLLIIAFTAAVNAKSLTSRAPVCLASTDPESKRLQRRAVIPDPEGFCGVSQTGVTVNCDPSDCCSQFNFCGNTTGHCGAGCQPAYGKCNPVVVLPPRKVPLPPDAVEATIHDECTTPGMLALALDDGHSPTLNAKFLAELKKNKMVATFFINGINGDWNISEHPEVVKRTFDAGHQIAQHTNTHADLSKLDDAGIVSELCNLDMAIAEALGGLIPRYLRFPYLEYSPNALKIAAFYGYIVVDVNLDTNDWDTTVKPSRMEYALKTYRKKLTKGSVKTDSFISLQHEIQTFTANKLFPKLLPDLGTEYVDKKKKPYKIVTVGQCLDAGSQPNDWYRQNIWHRDPNKDPTYFCPSI